MAKLGWAARLLAMSLVSCSGSGDDGLQFDQDGGPEGGTVDAGSAGEGVDQDAGDGDPTDANVADAGPGPAPMVTLLGAAISVLDCGEVFTDPGAQAADSAGSPLTVEVLGAGDVHTSVPGQFAVRYRATTASGATGEATREVHVCGSACGDLGKELINLTNWSVVQYEQNSQGDANWSLAQDGLSVTQTINSDASIYLSDFDATDLAVEGSWRMPTTGDDDFVGFVFGYQDRGHFYLFDWKKGTQTYGSGTANAGMSLKIVHAEAPDAGIAAVQLSTDDLWRSDGTNKVAIMQQNGVPLTNSIPWEFDTDYRFFLEFHAGSFRIDVFGPDGGLLQSWSVTDDTYVGGGFGYYNYSQGPVVYQSFTRRITPGACSTVGGA